MVQLGLLDNFKRQILQWDGASVLVKEASGLIGKTYLTSRKIHKVLIQTENQFPLGNLLE